MAKLNMKEWIEQIKNSDVRVALPIMTHPGIEMIGKNIVDACSKGDIHFQAIHKLNELYPSAATTVIMDLTVEAEAFGAEIVFPTHEVPSVINRLLSNKEQVEALEIPSLNCGRVQEYIKANRLSAQAITDKPVFAGCIGPFSLAGRLYDMTEIMMALYIEPDTIHLLLEKCVSFLTEYIAELKKSGVSGIVIAEPAAGLLSNEYAQLFSSNYIKRIVESLQDDYFSIILHNCGNTGHSTAAMTSVGAHAYHFGNKIDMLKALQDSPSEALVMGNIDPVSIMKQADAAVVYSTVFELLTKCSGFPNFVLSTGCDVPPNVPTENIEAFYKSLGDFNSKS